MYLSPQAAKNQEDSHDRQRGQRADWLRGPQLEGALVIVPSGYYNPAAAAAWRRAGFTFSPSDWYPRWERDCNRPAADGRTYSPAAWLKAAIRQYKELWPSWAGGEV